MCQRMADLTRLLRLRGSVFLDEVDAGALRGNALGDPTRRPLAVYTPPGYDAGGSRRYPVIYVLPPFGADLAATLATRPWEENILQLADRLIATAEIPPAVLVVVDAMTRLGGAQYIDSIHNGAYARYVVEDVVNHVDRGYRTIAAEAGRAVVGRSSGGFGALHLTMEHPGTFAVCAAHSPDTHFRTCYVADFAPARRVLEECGGIAPFIERYERASSRPGAWFAALNVIAMSAAYSPLAAAPFALDLPFDLASGEIRDDVLARWRGFDPIERVAERSLALGRLRSLWLDCGRRDEYALDTGARTFVARARAVGLAPIHDEYDGPHRGTAYRYAASLPAILAALDRS